jgi:hypothetical protein
MMVIFALFAEQSNIQSTPTATMEQYIRNVVDEVGNHPALLSKSPKKDFYF